MALTTAGAAACAKCKFFDTDAATASGEQLGLCRYNPPISQPSGDQAGVWPKVEANDWCGHFEAALA